MEMPTNAIDFYGALLLDWLEGGAHYTYVACPVVTVRMIFGNLKPRGCAGLLRTFCLGEKRLYITKTLNSGFRLYIFRQSRRILFLALTFRGHGCISASRRQLQWVLGF